ncbi:MAG TPA: hypothetical protein VMY37_35515 [Thermoguttaceae bacterium]|nr:hypothetical protein [Thermoguttaceae bacterium]
MMSCIACGSEVEAAGKPAVPPGANACPCGVADVPGRPMPGLNAVVWATPDWVIADWAAARLADAGADAQPQSATMLIATATAIDRPIVRRDPPMGR